MRKTIGFIIEVIALPFKAVAIASCWLVGFWMLLQELVEGDKL